MEEIRKKWTTYLSETKKKAAKHRKELKRTGGGPPLGDLTPFEETVIGFIGDTSIDGIPGGLDLAEEPEKHPHMKRNPSHIMDSRSSCPGKCKKRVDVFIISANNNIYLVFTVALFLQFLTILM